MKSKQITLKSRPVGVPQPTDFEVVEVETRAPGTGEVLVENVFMSVPQPIQLPSTWTLMDC